MLLRVLGSFKVLAFPPMLQKRLFWTSYSINGRVFSYTFDYSEN